MVDLRERLPRPAETMRLVIEPLRREDIPEIGDIERESFPTPWPASAYRRELDNRLARYFVVREVLPGDEGGSPFGRILGAAGVWVVLDEAHLTTIAVRASRRGEGFGERLLQHAIEVATDLGADSLTLEVRVSNEPAQALYRKYGFEVVGRRKNYYTDVREDALIMTVSELTGIPYQGRLRELRAALAARHAGVQQAGGAR